MQSQFTNTVAQSIVAVHGLNGSGLGTWTSKKNGVCWLSHPEFLPKYIRNARVLVYGYNANISMLGRKEPSRERIHHHAHTLVANLSAIRRVSRHPKHAFSSYRVPSQQSCEPRFVTRSSFHGPRGHQSSSCVILWAALL